MPILNEERMGKWLSGLGQGVRGASIEEFLLFIGGLILIAFAILWLQRRSDSKRGARDRELSESLFDQELQSRVLPPSAIALLEDMARAMDIAGRAHEVHRLFSDPALYDSFAHILIEDNPELKRPLRLLKPILGLGHGLTGQRMDSTEEVSPQQQVFLYYTEESAAGNVLSNTAQSLTIEMQDFDLCKDWPRNSRIKMQWQRKGVVYETDVTLREAVNGRIELDHSSQVVSTQRRQFLRASCDLSGSVGGRSVRIIDISGGGFHTSEKLPEDHGPDAALRCEIHLEGNLNVECYVRPLDADRFQFIRIRPGDQDRIVHFALLRNQERESRRSD